VDLCTTNVLRLAVAPRFATTGDFKGRAGHGLRLAVAPRFATTGSLEGSEKNDFFACPLD
jgi:hypothetical protein